MNHVIASSQWWYSTQTDLLFNPQLQISDHLVQLKKDIHELELSSHVLMATSGSSGSLKWVALAKSALLNSATAVNHHLKCHSNDRWLSVLPKFHVGGLSIYARGYLSGAEVISCAEQVKWNAQYFVNQLIDHKISLTSLVPAQVYDCVALKLSPPKYLRAVVIGGGRLSETLYAQGIALGWPLIPSYGLTECCSQVATASLNSLNDLSYPRMVPLNHVNLRLGKGGYLQIKSESLLTGYIEHGQLRDPKIEGWFQTEDRIEEEWIDGKGIGNVHRDLNFVKIGGESVDLLKLDTIIDRLRLKLEKQLDMMVFPYPDDRLGHVIYLGVVAEENDVSLIIFKVIEEFALHVLPFEKIRGVRYLKELESSGIKPLRPKLRPSV